MTSATWFSCLTTRILLNEALVVDIVVVMVSVFFLVEFFEISAPENRQLEQKTTQATTQDIIMFTRTTITPQFDQSAIECMHYRVSFRTTKRISSSQVVTKSTGEDILPRSLILHIMLYLPLIDIHLNRSVCNRWNMYAIRTLLMRHRISRSHHSYNDVYHRHSEVNIFEPSDELLDAIEFNAPADKWHARNTEVFDESLLSILPNEQIRREIKIEILSILSLAVRGVVANLEDRVFHMGSTLYRQRPHTLWFIQSHSRVHLCIEFKGFLDLYD